MSVIQWNNAGVASCRWTQLRRDVAFASIFGSQAQTAAAPLWTVDLAGVPQYWAQANQMAAFLESFEGYRNQLELWNLMQPAPRGTMRGALTLGIAAAQGATSITINGGAGQAGTTLLAGDLLGIGSGTTQQVVRVKADATASGAGQIVVSIGSPLRNAFLSGVAVIWDKPKALFRQQTLNEGIEYAPLVGQPWSLSLIEDWRP